LDSGHWFLKFGRLLAASRSPCIPALPTKWLPVGLLEVYLSEGAVSRDS